MSTPEFSILKRYLRKWPYLLIAILVASHILFAIILFRSPENKPYPPPQPPEQDQQATNDTGKGDTPTQPPSRQTPPPAAENRHQAKRYSAAHYHRVDKAKLSRLPKGLQVIRSGVVIDLDSHAILWTKDEDKPYPMASITKLMTAMLLLDRIEKDPQVTLETTVKVTPEDFKQTKRLGGVYLGANESFTLQEYLKCMLIKSANDCAWIVAKFLGGGDPAKFIQEMNRRAAELGLDTLHFLNPHGLPVDRADGKREENQGSALHIAYLAECAMKYPEIMKWAGTPKDCIRETTKKFDLHSTNHLLRDRVPGITGLKTGFTNTAGHCLVVTCTRNQRTILVLVMGVQFSDRGKTRDKAARDLLEWAYKQPTGL